MAEKYAALKEHVEKVGFHHYDYDPRFRQTNRSRECAWNYAKNLENLIVQYVKIEATFRIALDSAINWFELLSFHEHISQS